MLAGIGSTELLILFVLFMAFVVWAIRRFTNGRYGDRPAMSYEVRTVTEIEHLGQAKSQALDEDSPGASLQAGLNYYGSEGWTLLETVDRDGGPWLVFHKPGERSGMSKFQRVIVGFLVLAVLLFVLFALWGMPAPGGATGEVTVCEPGLRGWVCE